MLPSYFPMDTTKRCLVCLVLVTNGATFGLLCASMLTQDWLVVRPVRTGLNISLRNSEHQDPESHRFQGLIQFGLFDGRKMLNYGFGNRTFDLKIVCMSKLKVCMYSAKENATERIKDLHVNFYLGNALWNESDAAEDLASNEHLPSFGVWVLTVSSLSLAAMFAVTGGALTILNAARNSAELVFGFAGLLVWNALGGICSLAAIFSWLVQFLTRFRHNVMTLEELEQHWISAYRACVGFSFYLVVLAAFTFLVAVATLALIIRQPWVDRRLRSELRKKLSSHNFGQHSASSTMTKKSKDPIISE